MVQMDLLPRYRISVLCLLVMTFLVGCENGNTVVQAGEGTSIESVN